MRTAADPKLSECVRAAAVVRAGVLAAYVLGSSARGEARPASEVDVAFPCAPGAKLDSDARERALGRPVDLVLLSREVSARLRRYREAPRQRYSAEGVRSEALLDEVGGLGSFRNVLVHGYLDLDHDRVYSILERAPERFEAFAREVFAWLERRPRD